MMLQSEASQVARRSVLIRQSILSRAACDHAAHVTIRCPARAHTDPEAGLSEDRGHRSLSTRGLAGSSINETKGAITHIISFLPPLSGLEDLMAGMKGSFHL